MKLIKKILNKCNGLYYPQEYLCLAKESFHHPLYIYLANDRRIIKDITNSHIFAGYSPLIFILYSHFKEEHKLQDNIEIVFTVKNYYSNAPFEKRNVIAYLSLKAIQRQSVDGTDIVYYEGVKGSHQFLSNIRQYFIRLNNRLYNKKPGNIFLNGNLYNQVQIAYSIPRIISIITVNNEELFNLFPTDLHGSISDQYYISSLRHEGKACRQVEAAKRIVISEMNCNAYKTVYSLGKNHMQELKPKNNLPFGKEVSATFHLPIPRQALLYRELELSESFIYGIHKLLFYKIVHKHRIDDLKATLAHVHNCYATWRHNKGLIDNYLFR